MTRSTMETLTKDFLAPKSTQKTTLVLELTPIKEDLLLKTLFSEAKAKSCIKTLNMEAKKNATQIPVSLSQATPTSLQ